ncbi:hypothetical protein [Porphyromonas sp.]
MPHTMHLSALSKRLPRLRLLIASLLALLFLAACKGQETPEAPSNSLVGSYWTEGTGTMTLDFHSADRLRFVLYTGSTLHPTLTYELSYRVEGTKLLIDDYAQDTPFGEAVIVRGFTGQLEGQRLRTDFTTTSVELDAATLMPRFRPQTLRGYLFYRR